MTRLWILLLALLVGVPATAAAGDESSCGFDAEIVWKDFGDVVSAPFHWSSDEAIAAGAVAVTTASLVAWGDDAIARAATGDRNAFPYVVVHKVSELGRWYGKNSRNVFYTTTALIGGMWVAGQIDDNDRLVRTSEIATEAVVFNAILTRVAKRVFGRTRPYTGENARQWRPFNILAKHENRSFPSGHASTAWTVATALAQRHNDWWVEVPAYTFATAAALQRVDDEWHWTSDVVVGAAMGYAISTFLVNRHSCAEEGSSSQPAPASFVFSFRF